MKKLRNVLLMVPLCGLTFVVAWYVLTGVDLIPGQMGGRWVALIVLAIAGTVFRGILEITCD